MRIQVDPEFRKSLGFVLLVAVLGLGCGSDPLSYSGAADPLASKSGPAASQALSGLTAGSFDPLPVWPLCGRIDEDRPDGWLPEDGCPSDRFGNPEYTDGVIASTFGPRPLVSEGYRYDFHRGIDLSTPIGTAVFAVADGEVRIAGESPSYSDPLIQLRHFRPGANSCSAGDGCYHTNYLHMSGWVVSQGETVTKGQLIGYSGSSASGYAHLHFEVRDAPGAHDVYSNWSRDAVHPLQFLPYSGSIDASDMTVSVDSVSISPEGHPRPSLTVAMPSGDGLDLARVEVEIYRKRVRLHRRLAQPGESPVGLTPEGTGYQVNPPSFDLAVWNRMYSYKNSTAYPWSDFECGGAFESPFCSDLPPAYDANVHMDAASPGDAGVGQFNGITVWPTHHNASSTTYSVAVRFDSLRGPADLDRLCVKARAVDARGNATGWTPWGSCG